MPENNLDRRSFLKLSGAASLIGAAPLIAGPRPQSNFSGAMRAGTAKIDVTPSKPRVCPFGAKPGEGAHSPTSAYHPINIRCLTLNDGAKRMVFVTYDFNCLDVATPILRERLEKELGISPAYLVLLATHNHQAPIQIVPSNFDYGRELADRIFGLIQQAIKKEDGPVQLRFGTGHGYFLRVIGNTHADHEVQVLEVLKGQKPMAFLFNHPTHPLRGPVGYGASHPGFAMDELEEHFPGSLALYADGCGGNQYCAPPPGGTDPLEACKRRGHDLAKIVYDVVSRPMEDVTGPIESKWRVVDLPLADPIPIDQAMKLAEGIPLDIGFVPFPDPRRPHNWIRALIQHHKEGRSFPKKSSDYTCTDDAFLLSKLPAEQKRKYECRYEELLTAKIGPMKFVAIQGEPCAPIGARIKDVLRQEGPVMLFGYFAEHNLYIPTRELVRQDAYQSQVIRIQYASPVGWTPEVEDEIVRAALKEYGADIWTRSR